MKLEKFQGLEYVTVLDVPTIKKGKHEILAIDHADIEKAVAQEILKLGIRFRGKEVKILHNPEIAQEFVAEQQEQEEQVLWRFQILQ